MQFLIPQRSGLTDLAVSCAYMVGQDGAAWHSRVEASGGRLTVSRDTRDSGRLVTPWPLREQGTMALSTTMLAVRQQPYHLALELCRGTLARVLNLFSVRQDASRKEWDDLLSTARGLFIEAALNQNDIERSAAASEASLDICLQLISILFLESPDPTDSQVFSSRLTGFQLKDHTDVAAIKSPRTMPGNAFIYSPSWCQLETNPGEWNWEQTRADLNKLKGSRRRIICGPLFQLERRLLPDWLYLWDDDYDALQSYLISYIETVVEQLKPMANVWYSSAGTNVDRELRLTEEQRLRLTLVTLETLRKHDQQTPTLIGIKQPWGEYMGHADVDLSPWQFTDILLRADLGVSGIALEMNIACQRECSLQRDLMELNRLLDQWSTFGLPMVFVICGASSDELSKRRILELIEILQRKPSVQGIIWGQLRDASPEDLGLLDPNGRPKSLLSDLEQQWSVKKTQ